MLKLETTPDQPHEKEVIISQTVEEYCEAIYNMTKEGQKLRISSQLAERMQVSSATVFGTLKRLCRDGYVTVDEKTKAVSLTEKGETVALTLARRHNLVERFLLDIMGIAWDEVHEEACRLEHAISARVEQALDIFLNSPTSCPHGNPIPGNSLPLPVETHPLTKVDLGAWVIVRSISEEAEHEAGLLTYLLERRLLPGEIFRVESLAPLKEGLVLVNAAGDSLTVGLKIAHQIWVSLLDNEPEFQENYAASDRG